MEPNPKDTLEFKILRYLEPRQNLSTITTDFVVDYFLGTYSRGEVEKELARLQSEKILLKKEEFPNGWGYADRGDKLNVLQGRIDEHKNIAAIAKDVKETKDTANDIAKGAFWVAVFALMFSFIQVIYCYISYRTTQGQLELQLQSSPKSSGSDSSCQCHHQSTYEHNCDTSSKR